MNDVLNSIKVWSSCVRCPDGLLGDGREYSIAEVNGSPSDGDLVVARVSGEIGAYSHMENCYGRDVKLYQGDLVVGVLGTRLSGYSVRAEVPKDALRSGDELQLVSVGGLIGRATEVPAHLGKQALPLEIVGFPHADGEKVTTHALQRNWASSPVPADGYFGGRVIFVGATSAETGKTTFVCNAMRAVKKAAPNARVAGIKVVGTGRMRDMLRYKDSGADRIHDFVDAGWPSTYNIDEASYGELLTLLIRRGMVGMDYLLVEIGGDLLEGQAPVAIRKAAQMGAGFAFVVNDALGAMQGLRILEDAGVADAYVLSMRQNLKSLSDRIGRSVKDMGDERHIVEMVMGGGAEPKGVERELTSDGVYTE